MRSTVLRLAGGARLLRPQPLLRAPLAMHTANLRHAIPAAHARLSSTSSGRPSVKERRLAGVKDPAERARRQEYRAAELSNSEYHELSDYYLDLICTKYEDLQDTRTDVDVEFSAGVITITIAPIGTYVINKQPPNKEIWLSSPISGPKRYGYFIEKDSQGKTEEGKWLYYRDLTTLRELLLEETGVDLEAPADHSDQ
ncbi:hypothetical protein VUR80DRAFT_5218 [Thermomyces stellatus]